MPEAASSFAALDDAVTAALDQVNEIGDPVSRYTAAVDLAAFLRDAALRVVETTTK